MSKIDEFKDKMKRDMDIYDNEGNLIKGQIIEIFVKHNVSPLIAHILLKEIAQAIEKQEPAIKMANDIVEKAIKRINGEKNDK